MHSGWLNIKSAITGGDESDIIPECERGEDAAVKSYKDALDDDIPADIREIIERQYRSIKEVHDYMGTLEKGGDHDET